MHIENKKTQAEFEAFAVVTVGDKNQLKGSDARLFAVKLAKFASQKICQRRKSIQTSFSSVHFSWISLPSVTAIVVKEHQENFAPLQSVLQVQLSLQNHYMNSPEDDS